MATFRDTEVTKNHPLHVQYSQLQKCNSIVLTEVTLSSLPKDDVPDMLASELHLPKRLVRRLADEVFKKTGGHALFLCELLNKLVQESIIKYGSTMMRYVWDLDRISFIPTEEGVAGFIASNLNSHSPSSLHILQTLSCLGMQTDLNLLSLLEGIEAGILSSLQQFIDVGILGNII